MVTLGKMLTGRRYRLFLHSLQDTNHSQLLKVQSVSLRKQTKFVRNHLRVILNGLGKDAAQIISRINGFTYVETEYDYYTGELKEVFRESLTLTDFVLK